METAVVNAVEVLKFASRKGFAADRTLHGDDRAVAEKASGLRVVQSGYTEFPTIGIWQEQSAKITSRHPQQIRGEGFCYMAHVQLRGYAVRDFQEQA
jgi:hypothetical protein